MLWLEKNAPEFLPKLCDRQPNGSPSYRFWQRGSGYDRNLRSTRDIHEKIRYVHQNPIRRGLVKEATDWYWSSAAAWHTGIDSPIKLDQATLPPLSAIDETSPGSLMQDLL